MSGDLRETVRAYAKEFDVEAVWLFGSCLQDEERAADIDLAVEGIAPASFLDFYARLYFGLDKPVDLVDMSAEPPIAGIIRETGVRIYER